MIIPGYPRRKLQGQTQYADPQPQPRKRINGSVRAISTMGGPDQGSLRSRGGYGDRMPTSPAPQDAGRQAKIDAARADGTFATKRDKFNRGNRSSYMDEAGTIGARADSNLKGLDNPPPMDSKKIGGVTPAGGAPQVGSPAAPAAPAARAPLQAAANKPATPTIGTPASKPAGGSFTSVKPGSRDLYAEEKARQKSVDAEEDVRAGDALLAKANQDNEATLAEINNPAAGSVEAKALALQNAAKANIKGRDLISSLKPKGTNASPAVATPAKPVSTPPPTPKAVSTAGTVKPTRPSSDSRAALKKSITFDGEVTAEQGIKNANEAVVANEKAGRAPGLERAAKFAGGVIGDTVDLAVGAGMEAANAQAAAVKGVLGAPQAIADAAKPYQADFRENIQKPVTEWAKGSSAPTAKETAALDRIKKGLPAPIIADTSSGKIPETPPLDIPKKTVAGQGDRRPTEKEKDLLVATGKARAEGGPIKKDKPYLVGEDGPEVVVPKQDGTVIPNPKTAEKKRIGSRSILSGRSPRGSSMALAGIAKWMMGK